MASNNVRPRVHVYLILNPSPYTTDDMLNYKSLDSFKTFQNGWVRELLVKEVNERRIMIAKVSYYNNYYYTRALPKNNKIAINLCRLIILKE